MKVRVELLGPYKQLNKGEVAGFEREEAEELISRGVARRAPQGTQPVVAAALQIAHPHIQQLARAIQNLDNLGDREAERARLRADIAGIEQQEARALSLGERLAPETVEHKRLMVERLVRVEKEIQILTEQYEPLWLELQRAVQDYVRQQCQSIAARNVTPVLRELVSLVSKAARVYDALTPDLTALDELRALAVAAEMDPEAVANMLSEVIREIIGTDTLTSPATGRTNLGDFAFVLYGLALAQQRAAQVPA